MIGNIKIFLGVALVGFIGWYVWTAEADKKELLDLRNKIEQFSIEKDREDIIQKGHVLALENLLKSEVEREKKYAENLKQIRNEQDSNCFAMSPSMRRAILLLKANRDNISQ